MTPPTLGSLLYAFFEDYLKVQKGLSPASVRNYRDALRLFCALLPRYATGSSRASPLAI